MVERSVWRFDDCELDLAAWRVRRAGVALELEPKAIALLALLVERAGETVTKEEILAAVWRDVAVTDNALVRVVAQLRQALGDDAKVPRYIETVHTRGYRFVAPVERGAAKASAPAAAPVPEVEAEIPARPARGAGRAIAVVIALLVAVVSYLALRDRAPAREVAAPAGAPAPDPSIAVLPLENLGEPDQPHFADGMTDAIVTQLAKIEALKVIARGATVHYRANRPAPSAIARELGVAYLVEGSALLAEGRVRVSAHLVDGATDRQLWAESYEGDLADVLALQGRVAREIAREVRARVTPEEERRLASRRKVSPAAYEAYLQGLFAAETAHDPGANILELVRVKIGHFQRTVELEPGWGEAHGQLADAYRDYANVSDDHAERLRYHRLARAAAEHALELDPTVVDAHLVLAAELFNLDGDWEGAERRYREAQRLAPNNVEFNYAIFLRSAGRFDESRAAFRRAQERWPTSSLLLFHLGMTEICAGDLDAAEVAVKWLRERVGDETEAAVLEAVATSRRGRYAEAADLLERQRQALLINRATTFLQELAWASAKAGQPERARRAIRELEALGGRVPPPVLLALGDTEAALARLREAERERDYHLRQARCWPGYDEIVRLPEAARILAAAAPPAAR